MTKRVYSIAEKPGKFGEKFHNAGYKAYGLDYSYTALKVLPHELESFVRETLPQAHGCSVSMPHKVSIMNYLDFVEPATKEIGAVNTILNTGSTLEGFNTDYLGARRAIVTTLDVYDREVVLVGAGGVARAIECAVRELGGNLVITNRDDTKGKSLAKKLGVGYMPFEALPQATGYLLINATPVGMNSDESIVPSYALRGFDAVMDVVVGDTTLIQDARALGKKVILGRHMTVHQASEQFKIYTGVSLEKEFIEQFIT